MNIIISPAKKMGEEAALAHEEPPEFIDCADLLLARLRELGFDELKSLWGCSQKLAELNYERLQRMDLHRNLVPALLSYEGIQYQYMAASVLDQRSYKYLQEHLRILSGLYGVLRPFDGVVPYRLEMAAKLAVGGADDLYDFWGRAIYDAVMGEDRTVVNLASVEYSRCVSACVREGDRFLTIVFGELVDGRVIQKGTLAKMARGERVRFMAQHQIGNLDDIKRFDALDYAFAPERSSDDEWIFLKA